MLYTGRTTNDSKQLDGSWYRGPELLDSFLDVLAVSDLDVAGEIGSDYVDSATLFQTFERELLEHC